jgi:hypothetical protein
MNELRQAQQQAIEVMRSPPPVRSKLAALDALDRLALNPSGWFGERTIDLLTEARKAIITDRWTAAVELVEDARGAMEAFIKTVREAPDAESSSRKAALERANAELNQCVLVLSWLDQRPGL